MGIELLAAFTDVPQLMSRNDDDSIDRLNHRWTPALLILFAITVSTKQYVGDPISCWVPKHFTGAWEDYTNSFCWIRNTYYLQWDEEVSQSTHERQKNPIIYYQWVPLFLMVQALMFHLPIVMWRALNHRTGIDVNDVVETAEKFQKSFEQELRDKTLFFMTKQMDRYLGRSKRPAQEQGLLREMQVNWKWLISKICCRICGKKFGNYMVVLYMITKVIFLFNVVGQLFLLNGFLGHNFTYYGFYVMKSMAEGVDWTVSHRFPRVTMCDMDVRRLGNIHTYTVQCVLTINLFNEKIYLFLWFWLLLVAVITAVSLFMWILRVAFSVDRYRYIKKHLLASANYDDRKASDKRILRMFVHDYLRQDGVLVLRLVDLNTNKIVLIEFVDALWQVFKQKPAIQKLEEDEAAALEDKLPLKEDEL